MKIGAEDRSKLITASVLMMLSLIIAGRSLYEWQSLTQVVAASDGTHGTQIAEIHGKKNKHPDSLDPTLHFDRLQWSENHEYAGSGRNIFALNSEPDVQKTAAADPKPSPPARAEQSLPQVIPLQFFGFATIRGTPRKVCVHDDDSVFIAREGEIVGLRYKIVNVTSSSVDVEDLIENRRQTLALQPD